MDDPRHARDRPARAPTSPGSTTTSGPPRTSRRAAPRASTRPTASSTRWSSGRRNRDVRLSPINARQRELGAVFFEAAGWERPFWYGANERLLGEYGDRVMPREAEWESRWWSPIINAEHLAMRDRVGMVDLAAFAIFDVSGPGALRLPPGPRRQPGRRAGRTGRLHAAPERGRRDRGRPDDHAARPRPVPGRDRRRHGHARQEVVRRPPAGRRLGAAPRRDVRAGTRSGSGARGRATSLAAATRRRRVERGLPVRDLPGHRHRAASGRWRRGSRTSASSAGRSTPRWSRACACGTRSGRPAQAHGVVAGRDRRLRHDRPAREGLPRPRQRARARLRPRRGRHGAARRSRTPTSSARPPTSSSAPKPPAAILCTLTVDDPTSSIGCRALHARQGADPDARRPAARRREGSPVVRDQRRVRAVGRQAPPACPTCRPSRPWSGTKLAGRVLRRALPGDRRGRRQHAAVRPRQRADPRAEARPA